MPQRADPLKDNWMESVSEPGQTAGIDQEKSASRRAPRAEVGG
jgi:hypothetical protein